MASLGTEGDQEPKTALPELNSSPPDEFPTFLTVDEDAELGLMDVRAEDSDGDGVAQELGEEASEDEEEEGQGSGTGFEGSEIGISTAGADFGAEDAEPKFKRDKRPRSVEKEPSKVVIPGEADQAGPGLQGSDWQEGTLAASWRPSIPAVG